MNRCRVLHSTEFIYDGPVYESYNELRLRPMDDDSQSCLSFRLVTTPASQGSSYRDAYGNWVHHFNILADHRRLTIAAESLVLVHEAAAPRPGSLDLSRVDAMRDELLEEHFDWLAASDYVPHLPELLVIAQAAELASDGTVAGFAQAASDFIHQNFTYMKGATHVHSSARDSLALRAGVCQDFAHVLLGVLRIRGLPARYVSGYLVTGSTAPDAKQEEIIGGQASHAWTEVMLPEQGWVGLDPTLGKPIELRHVRVAYGRDYGDVPPVRGVYKGRAGQSLSVDVRIRPALDEAGHETHSEISSRRGQDQAVVTERPQQHSQQ
jgi:transglutaminase-like putative cysteine protease